MNFLNNGKINHRLSVIHTMKSLLEKFKTLDSFKKRGIIYLSIAVLFLGYEFIFHRPPRMTVLLLWFGLIVIAIFVMTTLKDQKEN